MKMTLTAVTALMLAVSPLAAQSNPSAQSAVSFVDQQNQSEVLGSDFIGTPVTTRDGQQIGKIANLVFDQNGRIELAVIGVGGFLGIGEKDVAVPFDSVKSEVINNKHVFVIDSTKDQLQAAPTFKTLDRLAFNQRMADWRAKASESWADIKSRAAKVYDDAKTRVNEARQPSEQPK
jgi:sporulation protein YlmC with PRC-barrel domain